MHPCPRYAATLRLRSGSSCDASPKTTKKSPIQEWTNDDHWAVEEEIHRHERWAKEWRSAGRTEEGSGSGAPEQVSLVGVTDDEAVALILSAKRKTPGQNARAGRALAASQRKKRRRRDKYGT